MIRYIGTDRIRKLTDEEVAMFQIKIKEAEEKRILLKKIQEESAIFRSDCMKKLPEDNSPVPLASGEEKPELEQDEEITFKDVQELAASLPAEGNVEMNYKLLTKFAQLVLQTWKIAMNDRSFEECSNSIKTRTEFFLYKSKSMYLNSLKMHLKEFSLPEEILDGFTKIVLYCLEKDYVKANETYSKIAKVHQPLLPINFDMSVIQEKIEPPKQSIQTNGIKLLIGMCEKYFPSDQAKCDEKQETPTTKNN